MQIRYLTAAMLSAALLSGCTTTRLRDSFARTTAALTGKSAQSAAGDSDPFHTELSEEFRNAQKLLRDPEQMMLVHARLMEDRGEYARAHQRYREILTAYPKNVEAGIGLARVEQKTGRTQQAEDILKRLAAKYPDNTTIRMAQGRMLADDERFDAAAEKFREVVRSNGADQAARYELGITLARLERYDEALPHLTFAVGEAAATYNIGYLLYEDGRLDEAARWFDAALDGHPDERTRVKAQEMLARLSGDASESRRSPRSDRTQVAEFAPPPSGSPAHSAVSRVSLSQPQPTAPELPRDLARPVSHTEVATIRPASQQRVTPAGLSGTPSTGTAESHWAPSAASGEQVPRWGGPSQPDAMRDQSVAAQPALGQQPAEPQQPPMWRSRSRND